MQFTDDRRGLYDFPYQNQQLQCGESSWTGSHQELTRHNQHDSAKHWEADVRRLSQVNHGWVKYILKQCILFII